MRQEATFHYRQGARILSYDSAKNLNLLYTIIMLTFGERLQNVPVLSLQTGAELARTDAPVIDPANLKIIAYYVIGAKLDFSPALLFTVDIREVADIGFIVNSSDDFIAPGDVVSQQDVIGLNFTPIGLKVVDTNGRKLGKVTRYSVDQDSFIIQQLHVTPPLTRIFSQGDFLVHRNQITAISDKVITVRTPTVKAAPASPAPVTKQFTNPFRQPQRPEAEHSDKS